MDSSIPVSPDHFPVGCLVTDDRRRILFANQYFDNHFGSPSRARVGADLFDLLSPASQIMYDSYVLPILLQDGKCEELRLGLVSQSGETRPAVVSVARDTSSAGRFYWSIASAERSERLFGELSEARKLLQQKVTQLHSLSDTDHLTGLPNRAALSNHLSQKMSGSQPGELAFILAFIDLDGFKQINDSQGHDVGDKVLRLVARRMANNLRTNDIIARFGGDEFVVLLHGEFDAQRAAESVSRLLRQIAEPVELDSLNLKIGASAGVTIYPQADRVEPDQLIRQADQAMYQAKLAGRDQVCLFNIDQERHQRSRNTELLAVRSALENHQLELYYQPKVHLRTGRVLGTEALIRWNHPDEGLKSPADFLPVIEGTKVGIDLGQWVIETALLQLQEWLSMGLDLHMSVNIAGYHLQHPDFFQELNTILSCFSNVPRQRLEIEVLETSTIEDIRHAAAVLTACRMLGIRVSLDDFGTGFSTLGHLRDLSVDVLKIDRSFVQNMLGNSGDMAIIKGIIGFARAFDCDLVAEGIETLQHGQSLLELGCEWGQGYFIARPMPAGEFLNWMENWKQHGQQSKC